VIERVEVEGFAGLRLRAAGDADVGPDAGLSATWVPGAGMIGVSLRDGDEELLGQRHGVASYAHDGKTMGIPLLHPWANRLGGDGYRVGDLEVDLPPGTPGMRRDENGLPIHGVLAGCPHWQVEPQAAAGEIDRLAATLDYGAHPELLAAFPFPHRLRIEVSLASGEPGTGAGTASEPRTRSRTLTVRTRLTATGDRAVPVAYGFHPYLRLPDVPRADWRVELPAMRALELDDCGIPTGASSPAPAEAFALSDRALDDGFVGTAPGTAFAVAGGGRRIEVRFGQGFGAAQVFAPLAEEVVCFEPMTAPTDALRSGDGLRLVAPGEQDETVFEIAVGDDR
jgi:aldose 1-epimerase